jgi:hypothetical protein
MSRLLAYGYVVLGFLYGFTLGVVTERESALTIERIATFLGLFLILSVWQWYENISHRQHMAKWEALEKKGRLYFIILNYLLYRGVVIVILVLTPFISILHLSRYSFMTLLLTIATALVTVLFLGTQEWADCKKEYQIASLRKIAEQAENHPANSQ